jgi:hypothetical protein
VCSAQRQGACYLFPGGVFLIGAANSTRATGSTGLCFIIMLAASLPRKLSPCQFSLAPNRPAEQIRLHNWDRHCRKHFRRTARKMYIRKCRYAASSESAWVNLLREIRYFPAIEVSKKLIKASWYVTPKRDVSASVCPPPSTVISVFGSPASANNFIECA